MKKLLLIGTSLMFAISSALAFEETIPDQIYNVISPNGEWVAGSAGDGAITILNLKTNESFFYNGNAAGTIQYDGFAISDNGILAGTTTNNNAAYWENGKWTELRVPNPEFMSNALDITPDGSVICGGVGQDRFSVDSEGVMLVPAVWYRQADGTYGDPVILPHPVLDFTGRLPQYVTANAISDDGRIVVGNMRDYMGFMSSPIVYTCDDNGKWSYSDMYMSLLNPLEVDFPEWPGDGPEMPSAESFMTPEEIAAYNEALEEWEYGMEYPEYEDYMTPAEYAEYMAVYREWAVENNAWYEKFLAFDEAYARSLDEGIAFVFNNLYISPDGKYFAATRAKSFVQDPLEGPKDFYAPVLLQTDQLAYTELDGAEDLSLISSGILQDYSVLANYVDPDGILPRRAYIVPFGTTEAQPLEDFLAPLNPSLAGWMKEEMSQDVYTLEEGVLVEIEGYMCSGVPVATPDLGTVICYNSTYTWVEEPAFDFITWLFTTNITVESGVEGVAPGSGSFSVQPGGNVVFNGDFVSLEIYDTAGSLLRKVNAPVGTVTTGLDSGIYIIRAVTSDGNVLTRKVTLR